MDPGRRQNHDKRLDKEYILLACVAVPDPDGERQWHQKRNREVQSLFLAAVPSTHEPGAQNKKEHPEEWMSEVAQNMPEIGVVIFKESNLISKGFELLT